MHSACPSVKDIAAETRLTHRPVADGGRVSGTYRRNVQLASGRFAMPDDGIGFSLVPWKLVIELRLGQTVSAVSRGSGASWDMGRHQCGDVDADRRLGQDAE